MKIIGYLDVFKDKGNSRELVHSTHNTIDAVLYTTLRDKLLNRDSAGRGAGIDGITWGYKNPDSGTFADGTYAGTFNAGSNGNCVFSAPTYQQIRAIGTFPFTGTKTVNFFEIGQGYTAPGTAVTQMITTRYAYQDSLYFDRNSISYDNGETMIVSWVFQLGV